MPRLPATDAAMRCGIRPIAVTSLNRIGLGDRQVRVHAAQERSDFGDRAAVVAGPHEQRDARDETLSERHVDVRLDSARQPNQSRVRCHADDR